MDSITNEEADQILKDPSLLYRFKKDLDRRIAGEDKNKVLLVVIQSSALADNPLGAAILGPSSVGKSHLMNMVSKGFEGLGIVEDYTRLTAASPDRLEGDYTGKILKIQELKGLEQAQSTVRVWISEGKLNLLTTIRDDKGNIKTAKLTTQGIPVFLTTSTAAQPDEELLNRIFIISVDESEEQTRRVLEFEAKKFGEIQSELDPDANVDSKLYQALGKLSILGYHRIWIPYNVELAKSFPVKDVRVRRDFNKFQYLIAVIAWMHQKQRPLAHIGENKLLRYVVALPCDFHLAWKISEDAMKDTLLGIQKRASKILELFKDAQELNSAQVANETGYSQSTARQMLNLLVDRGYLIVDDSQKTHIFSKKSKEVGDLDASIKDIETFLEDFDEDKLRTLCIKNNLTIHQWEYRDSYIDPFTGEEVPLPSKRIMSQTQTKEENIANPKSEVSNASKSRNEVLPNVFEVIDMIRHSIIGAFIENDFIDYAISFGLKEDEASKLFKKLVEDSKIARNPEGYWEWIKGSG